MSKKSKESENVRIAEDVLRGRKMPAQEIFDLAMRLKSDEQEFGYARRLLARARMDLAETDDNEFRTSLRQQHALCTYKDHDLAESVRFDRAISILAEDEDLQTATDQETLGIAGAIYKDKWYAFGQREDLEASKNYYQRGCEKGIKSDLGYTAINYAFVLDLLADQEWTAAHRTGAISKSASVRSEEAEKTRQEIIDASRELSVERENPKSDQSQRLKTEWWFQMTIAEAHFGLGKYWDAEPALKKAAAVENVPEWEFESAVRQLATLARLKLRQAEKGYEEAEIVDSEPWKVLEVFLGERAPGVWSVFLGRIGLALSGGGFRASLFHIGVLAKLAELDVLRHIEVLSCVSGGSILGAHYYLKVRQLLRSNSDKTIKQSDYIKIVADLEREFVQGIQKNIRSRVIGSFWVNLKMAFLSDYSRTERLGELYEKYLYSQTENTSDAKFWLNDLFIHPQGEPASFRPKYHNWRRCAKVPMLVLNATTLNTGHNWQFTASWMGEPPISGEGGVDTNYRLRRMYYSEAPENYRQIRLGYAVAASSCVPSLFDPLNLPNLYPDNVVRLVDGGVQDNQGATALLDQGCNVLLVSDASGQMGEQQDPSKNFIGVPLRSNTILQARIRLSEFENLASRRRASLLRGLMFLHMKKDLEKDSVDWINCEDPVAASDDARPAWQKGELTSYGVRKEIQAQLAAIRTDLDAFNDAEAAALMTSGYLMTEEAFPRAMPGFPRPKKSMELPPWRFLKIKDLMQRRGDDPKRYAELKNLLGAARESVFKVWKLTAFLRVLAPILGVAAAVAVIYAVFRWRAAPLVPLSVGTAAMMVLSLLGSLALAKLIGPRLTKLLGHFGTPKRIESEVWRIVVFVVLAFVGMVVSWIHIHIFDRWYLRIGQLGRVTGEPVAPLKKAQ